MIRRRVLPAALLVAAGLVWFGAWHVHRLRTGPWPAIRNYVEQSSELRQVVGPEAGVGWLPLGRTEGAHRALYTVTVRGSEGRVRTRFEVRAVDSRWRVVAASYGGSRQGAELLPAADAERLRMGTGQAMRAYALAQNGRLADALAGFDSAVALDDANPRTFHWRGWVRGEAGDLRGAVEDYRRAVELDPGYGDAHYGLGVAAGRVGDLESSLRHLDRAAQLKPHDGLVHFARAVTRSRLGDDPGTRAGLQQSCRLGYAPACEALAGRQVDP